MMNVLSTAIVAMLIVAAVQPARAQYMPLGDVLITVSLTLNSDADPAEYEAFLRANVLPAWEAQNHPAELHVFRADRGERTGDYLMAWRTDEGEDRSTQGNREPVSPELLRSAGIITPDHHAFISLRDPLTEYLLVGSPFMDSYPEVEILGIHRLEVKPNREAAFEAFVRDTLYHALAEWAPGMHLVYYRGRRGTEAGKYIALFAIETVAAREQYWPTGAPETEALTTAFKPLKPMGVALSRYLVEGSYLTPDTGAAGAYFESLDWNDYVHLDLR